MFPNAYCMRARAVRALLGVEGEGGQLQASMSARAAPSTPTTPATPTSPASASARKDNVWRSVFHPASNVATRGIGAQVFDKPQPNSPTIYDWYAYANTSKKVFMLELPLLDL